MNEGSVSTELEGRQLWRSAGLEELLDSTYPGCMASLSDRFLGSFLGLAVGDALGAPLEFRKRDQLAPVRDMIGGGKFQLEPGQYTDDTSMALCLAASLIENQAHDPLDQLERYDRWLMDGYMSCSGRSIGAGQNTLKAIRSWKASGSPLAPMSDHAAGNGSLMRLAPVVIHFFTPENPLIATEHAVLSSITTHNHPIAIDACRLLAFKLHKAFSGAAKDSVLAHDFPDELHPEIDSLGRGGYKAKLRHEVSSSGYARDTLEAALWAFHATESFEEGMILAVNLAGDADTVGAVFGQIAGAHYGVKSIPKRWIDTLHKKDLILHTCSQLGKRDLVGRLDHSH